MTNQAILLDIAHGAAPGFDFQGNELDPESDPNAGAFTYDDALLARHKVSGDGRVNENITLTSVHHVFHEEHNIQANAIKLAAIRDAVTGNTLDMLNGTSAEMDGWLAVDIDQATLDGWAGLDLADDAAVQAVADTLSWDGEKLYQAARVITESEYNHIAVDQYVSGLYPALPEFVSYSTDINLDISLEFAQAIFRLGHSQLRETVQIAVTDGNGIEPGQPGYTPTYTEQGLFDVFLNPDAYDMYGPAGITAGLLTQQGNEMDEFVTAALQQSLVGVPLDLPALNIARGRDVGLPSLNELRQEVFDGLLQNTSNNANGAGIAPYHSWADFGAHLRTPESLANFIAAYGRDTDGTFGLQAARDAYQAGTGTLADMRTAAQRIVDAAADVNDPDHAAALKFMQGTATGEPVYTPPVGVPGEPGYVRGHWDVNSSSGDQGFWDIDLWIGGLAEQALFDGPLGTTFSFIILDFAQRLQDGDRFYYLYRMPVGQHLGDQIIGEQFADLVMRTTGLEHIPDAFGTPSAVYILDGTDAAGNYQDNARDGIGANDAYGDNDYFNATLEALPDTVTDVAVLNASFEDQSLASDGAGPVIEDAVRGNYTYGSPQDWALTGTGGLFAPTAAAIAAAGHAGGNVAWLNPGATLTQATGVTLIAGNSYDLSVNIGDRIDQAGSPSGEVQLIDQNGNVLASAPIATTDGQWSALTLSLTATAAMDGLELSVRIVNSGSGAGQVLVDNVGLTMTEPGGSANDGHIVVIGLSGDDFIVGALGDDVIYGDAGNDVLEGAQGNDHLYGGDGDDYITDYENDDFISGGNGNDTIFAGPGVLDTAHGNDGDDEVHGGDGIDEVFGDNGNDRLYGEGDTDLMIGGDGNDYMEGGDGVDEMFGGNGSDWMRGGVGDDNINGGSGNDLMEGGLGATANDGDRLNGDSVPGTLPVIEYNGDGTLGDMDIASYEHVDISVMASLQTSNNAGTSSNLLDSYALVDGLSGSAQNDILEGGEADAIALNGANNYLVGGGGNDRLTGLGDDGDETTGQADFIFGDSVIVDANLYWIGDPRHDPSVTVTGLIENWYDTGDTRVQFSDGSLGHILGEVGTAGTTDTAVYRGNRADYTVEGITINGQQAVKITHSNPADDGNGGVLFDDGVDILVGVELAEFADQTISIAMTPPELDLHALTLGNAADNFNTASWANSNGTMPWAGNWTESGDSGGVTGGQIQIDGSSGFFGSTNQLRIFDNGDGASIQRGIDLSGAASAVLSFNYAESSFDNGESVEGSVSFDGGATWHVMPDLALNAQTGGNNHSYSVDLATLLGVGESLGADTVIRFTALTSGGGNGYIAIDNLNVEVGTLVNDGSNDYAASFTEGDAPVAIADGALIVDDSPTMERAMITLTNPMAGDVMTVSGLGGTGISASVDTFPDRIVVTLTGTASNAAYAAALARVSFENTSNAPDETPRVIETKVFDGFSWSNLATTTVDVTNVLQPPQANNDAIVSNAQSFSVPVWTLLANDLSEGLGLSVTNVSENSSGFSAVLNGANVDVTKTSSFSRSFSYTATDSIGSDNANASVSIDSFGTVSGGNGDQILIGDGGGDTFDAGGGDDIILAGGGNDTIVWNASSSFFFGNVSTDGHDFVDGQGGTDTFVVTSSVTGGNSAETFELYTTAEALLAGYTGLKAATEIVVTRNGAVIAELANVEEIVINTGAGNDTVLTHGDFTGTALAFNTIHIDGGDGDDTVDITGQTSAHRIVFNGGAGANMVIGDHRTQDVLENAQYADMTQGASAGQASSGPQGASDDVEDDPSDDGDSDGDGDWAAPTPTPDMPAPEMPAMAAGEVIEGTDMAETLLGGDGADLILAGAGADNVVGQGGSDMIFGDGGADRIFAGEGNDVIEAGAGNDQVFADEGDDLVIAGTNDGSDSYWGGAGSDTLDYAAISTNMEIDLGSGLMGHGQVTTDGVTDQIYGFENIIAGSGNDRIVANAAANSLDGGAGQDTFVFNSAGDADGDVIAGFTPGDKIDLSGIDANQGAEGHQSFVLFASGGFTAAGQLSVSFETRADGDHTLVMGNLDDDMAADFEIDLLGRHDLTSADFDGLN